LEVFQDLDVGCGSRAPELDTISPDQVKNNGISGLKCLAFFERDRRFGETHYLHFNGLNVSPVINQQKEAESWVLFVVCCVDLLLS
jgi:hypothetical protein